MTRRPILAGNWKMNLLKADALSLARGLRDNCKDFLDVDIVICPVFPYLECVKDVISTSNIKLGAQNLYHKESGAYTGEVSPAMIKDIGCNYVILGHSERREYFKETNTLLNKKIKSALKFGLIPIYCVGETLEERESGKMNTIIEEEIMYGLEAIDDDNLANIVIAYEPIWAIGTGLTATPEQANSVHIFIRNLILNFSTYDVAERIRILYGGSVTQSNIDSLIKMSDIDGALVGGASLKIDTFTDIVRISNNNIGV